MWYAFWHGWIPAEFSSRGARSRGCWNERSAPEAETRSGVGRGTWRESLSGAVREMGQVFYRLRRLNLSYPCCCSFPYSVKKSRSLAGSRLERMNFGFADIGSVLPWLIPGRNRNNTLPWVQFSPHCFRKFLVQSIRTSCIIRDRCYQSMTKS